MATPRTPRRRPDTSSGAPTTLTECARRYHACALALAKSLGLPMTAAFLQEYHSAISCVYIEAGRAGVRLPSGVQLPPLVQASGEHSPPEPGQAAPVAGISEPSGENSPPNGDTPPLTVVPPDAGLPCGGQAISALKPAALSMLISKVARLLHDEGERWVTLLHALQAERAARLDRGRKPRRADPDLDPVGSVEVPEGDGDVP
jgi:hypothetical protein